MSKKRISIVIPTKNESSNIEDLVSSINDLFESMHDKIVTIIIVDDSFSPPTAENTKYPSNASAEINEKRNNINI